MPNEFPEATARPLHEEMERDAMIETIKAMEKDADAINHARAKAPHTEEAGEVCTPDCQGCNDPVTALITDRDEARSIAFGRGRENDALRAAAEDLLTALAKAVVYAPNIKQAADQLRAALHPQPEKTK